MKAVQFFKTVGVLCAVVSCAGSLDAGAQTTSTVNFVCSPSTDLTCSPKLESGRSHVTKEKQVVVLLSNRPHLAVVDTVREKLFFPKSATGACGGDNQACPSKSFEKGFEFTGQAASATLQLFGATSARTEDTGRACAHLFADLYVKEGTTEKLVESYRVGGACETSHTTHANAVTLTQLSAGKSYSVKGRLVCVYAGVSADEKSGVICSNSGLAVTLVWPFGQRK